MPIMSVFLCFSMQIVLGIYWIISAVIRIIQQIVINKFLDRKSIDELVEDNLKKVETKNAKKKSVDPSKVNTMAQMYTKKLDEIKAEAEKEDKNSTTVAKPGSLTARANMVRDYNNRNNK